MHTHSWKCGILCDANLIDGLARSAQEGVKYTRRLRALILHQLAPSMIASGVDRSADTRYTDFRHKRHKRIPRETPAITQGSVPSYARDPPAPLPLNAW